MTDYQPTWRRPIAQVFRWKTQAAVLWCVRRGGRIRYRGLTVLDWTFLAIVLGCVQTTWLRLSRIVRAREAKGHAPGERSTPPEG